jgi:hypothetical protein
MHFLFSDVSDPFIIKFFYMDCMFTFNIHDNEKIFSGINAYEVLLFMHKYQCILCFYVIPIYIYIYIYILKKNDRDMY